MCLPSPGPGHLGNIDTRHPERLLPELGPSCLVVTAEPGETAGLGLSTVLLVPA